MAGVLKNNSFQTGAVTQEKLVAGTFPGTAFAASPDPKITTVTITNASWTPTGAPTVSQAGGWVVLTGVNFKSGCQALIGNTAATTTTFVSSTTVRVRLPPRPAGSYFLYLVNTDGGTGTRINAVTYA